MKTYVPGGRLLRRRAIILSFMAYLFVISQAAELSAATLEEEARREGKVVFYSSQVLPDVLALVEGFQKKYPSIKIEYERSLESAMHERLLSEKRAGKSAADVVHSVGIWANLYKKEGLLGTPYISPEAKSYPQGFKDPEGYWTAYYATYFAFIYNTKLVPRKELPKTYESLLDAKWKHKIGMYNAEFEWYTGMMNYLGEEKGRQFMKRLADQDLMLRAGRTLITNLLVAGEYSLALGAVHRALDMQKAGASVDIIPFAAPTLAAIRCIGIPARNPHPAAARLLVDFILSREGQTIVKRRNYQPVHPDIQLEPALEAIRRNQYPIKPGDPDILQVSKKEYEKILLKR